MDASRKGPSASVGVRDFRLSFLGAAGTVTGSKYVLDTGSSRLLIDCGLFQGLKELRLRNWAPLPIPPTTVSAIFLSHAHLDHSGYLPLIVKSGFAGPIYCTEATRDLCGLLLPDSGFLQEKDAEYANRKGFSKHSPALPLYTKREAEQALTHLRPVKFGRDIPFNGSVARFWPAGHILGAAIIEFEIDGTRVVFSGDLGRSSDAIMKAPKSIERADYLVIESTYGNRDHDPIDPEDALCALIVRTVQRGGTVVVPAFAVGRAQSLLFHLSRLKLSGRIPNVPIFLDSPMAIDASKIYCEHLGEHRLSAHECHRACGVARYVQSPEESKEIGRGPLPKVIISASGMATGGRVLHHLKHYAPDRRSSILFAGFQAAGTRGAKMIAGAPTVRIHGQDVAVNAEIANLSMLSAHADRTEIMAWLRGFRDRPKMTFVTHGEPEAARALSERIGRELGWTSQVPEDQSIHSLPAR